MNVRREHLLDTLAELASSDQREIASSTCSPGQAALGLPSESCSPRPANGWFCGVDETDYAERYPASSGT